MPLKPNGKIDRDALPDPSDYADEREPYVAPRNALEAQLAAIWEQLLGVRPIGMRDDFFALGGHSLAAAQMSLLAERAVGRRVPPGVLLETPTIEALARRIADGTTADPRPTLVQLRKGGNARPLFFVHEVGGSLLEYRALLRSLRGDQPVYGLQAVGLADLRKPLETVEAMAERYVEDVRSVQPQGPYALAGYSGGGLIAYEMAQRLHAAGESVGFLAMLDVDATIRHRPTVANRMRFQLQLMRDMSPQQRGRYACERVWMWSGHVVRIARAYLGGPTASGAANANPEYSAVRAANERAVYAYRPRRYWGHVTLFRAVCRDPVWGNNSRALGWRRLARGGLTVVDVPGDHFSMMRGHGARALAKAFQERLDRSRAPGPPGPCPAESSPPRIAVEA